MLNDVILANALVVDVECVPGVKHFDELSPAMQALWEHKAKGKKYLEEDYTPQDVAESYHIYAGIYAEFGKIICISAGMFRNDKFYVKSYSGKDEKELLTEFASLLNEHFNVSGKHFLVGHNIKEFDIPYICRRMLVQQVELPEIIDIAGKKPWEVIHLDTMQYWKFGDFKSYTSLKLLAEIFGIPTPKDDIDGSDVARVFWQDDDLERIVVYCQKDVVTTARLLQRYKGLPALSDSEVEIR